jgi:hydrogenase-4 component E
MNITLLNTMFAGAALMMAIHAVGSLRLRTLVRSFAISSFFLALLIAGIGYAHGNEHLYLIAAANVGFKVVLIPLLVVNAARASGASERLRAYLRPATTYFIILGILAFVLVGVQRSPFFAHADPGYLLYLAVTLVLMGLVMMIARRDVLSQMMGFLVMENGIATFSYATVSSLPILIELGIFVTVTVGVLLMSFLSSHVRQLYGTEDTDRLRELTDD